MGVPKFYGKINGEFHFWAFYELLQDLEVQNTENAPSSGKFGRQGFFHYWELFHYWERSETDT